MTRAHTMIDLAGRDHYPAVASEATLLAAVITATCREHDRTPAEITTAAIGRRLRDPDTTGIPYR